MTWLEPYSAVFFNSNSLRPIVFFLTRIILTGRKAPQILGWEILLIWLETFCTAGIRLIIILVIHHSIIIKKNQFLRQWRRNEKLSVPSRYTSKSQSAMDSKIDIYLEYSQFYQQQRNVLYLTILLESWELSLFYLNLKWNHNIILLKIFCLNF